MDERPHTFQSAAPPAPPKGSGQGTLHRVFGQPMLRRVSLSWGASKVALWGWVICMNAVLYMQSGVWAVGAFVAARLVPGALLTPLFAVVADRIGIMRGLVLLAWVRCLATAACAIALGCEAAAPWLILLGAIESLGSQPQDAEQVRVLPWFARSPEELTAANGVTELLRVAGILLGPTIGGALLLIAHPAVVVAGFAALHLAAAALLFGSGDAVARRPGLAVRTIARRMVVGGKFVFGGRDTLGLVAFTVGASFCFGTLSVFGAGLAMDQLAMGANGPAVLKALFGLGGLLAGLAVAAVVRRNLARISIGTTVAIGALMVVMGLVPNVLVVFTCMGLIGFASVPLLVAISTLMQRGVSQRDHDAVVGFNTLCSNAAMGAAGMGAAAIASGLGLLPGMSVTGVSLIAIALLFGGSMRRLDERTSGRNDQADALRACAKFANLAVGPLDELAAATQRVSLAVGATLPRAGSRDEHAYVVARGRLAVVEHGDEVATWSRGDLIGYDVATGPSDLATAVASEPTEAYRLRKDDLRAALGVHDEGVTRKTEARS